MKHRLRRLLVPRPIHRRLIFPSILALRGEFGMYSTLRELQSLQWSGPDGIRYRQQRHLASILSFARRTVPLYRKRWDIDAPVEDGEAFRMLRELPFLTKGDLQQNASALVSDQRPVRVTEKTTGGSTGQPVTVLKGRDTLARERAASWLAYGWFGLQIGDRGVRFWGSPEAMDARRLRFAASDLAMNRIRFSAFAFDQNDLERYWVRSLSWSPDYLYGYVSMLCEFARHLKARGHDGRRLGVKAIVTTAEALTAPQCSLLEEVFGAPVQNEYGCGEVGPIAYECREGSLHVMADNLVVELLQHDGSPAPVGGTGHVVVTDLHNRVMPLIRYRVGDRAVRGEECTCGRGLPVIREVKGRAYDFVKDQTGKSFHGEYFMYLFEDLRDRGTSIDQFRVTQTSEDRLVIEVTEPQPLEAEEEAFIRQRIDRYMTGMEVMLERVEDIERLESGKTRIIRNEWLKGIGSDE